MSYNIDSVEVLEGSLTIDIEVAKKFKEENEDELPGRNFIEEVVITGEESAIPSWCGEGSGWAFNLFKEALSLTKGEADLLLTWEGGDEFSGLRVRDGVVREMAVEMSLVEKDE